MKTFWQRIARPWHREIPNAGFSLMEMLVTISLLSVVFVIVTKGLMGTKEEADRQTARIGLSRLANTLETYRLKTHKYPATEDGLTALVKTRLIKKRDLQDTFGHDISYESTGKGFTLTSAGPDGVPGNRDDVIYSSDDDEDSESPQTE